MSAFDEERVSKETNVADNGNDCDEFEDDDDYDEEEINTDWVFSYVKRPVDIYLPDEDKWFPGTLLRIVDNIDRIALVSYDDEDFADEKVPFEDLRVGVLPSKKRDKERRAAEKRAAAASAAAANTANANNSSTQVAVNEIKFKRYLHDLVIGEEFVPTWQPPFEKASRQEIDELLSLLPSFSSQHAESKLRADLQEFDRSLQQSRTYQDCFVLREDSYLVCLPLHLPPVARAPGTFISQKEQEKLASFRQTQFRLGAFILKKDASEIVEVLSEDAYMEKLASMQKGGKDAVTSVNLVTLPAGTIPLPVKEPHNQSNKSPVLVARILHAIDTWNATHTGEDVLDIFCPVKRDDVENSETVSELSSSAVSYEASSSPAKVTKFSREEVLLGALQGQCHRLSSKIYYNATCSFHALMVSPLVLRDAHRTRMSFSEWQDLLRRQRANSMGEDSILSMQSDHTNATNATPTNNNPGNANCKARSDSVVSTLSEKDVLSKSRSGSIVTEKELQAANHNKSRSGSIVTEKDHHQQQHPPHGNKSRSGSAVDKDLSATTGKKNAVRLNSRAARKQAEDDFPENT